MALGGEKPVPRVSRILTANAKSYCETTTIHGFGYWSSETKILEKIFWVIVVCTGFTCASFIISTAVQDWRKDPGVVKIDSFFKVGYICRAIQFLFTRCHVVATWEYPLFFNFFRMIVNF
jgi:hypothetical protein